MVRVKTSIHSNLHLSLSASRALDWDVAVLDDIRVCGLQVLGICVLNGLRGFVQYLRT